MQKGNCQWQKTGQFVLKSMVRNLAWHPTGSWKYIYKYIYIYSAFLIYCNSKIPSAALLKQRDSVWSVSVCVFVRPGCSLLTGSDSLQLWSHVNGVKDEAEERKQADMIKRDSHSAWRCTWQSK